MKLQHNALGFALVAALAVLGWILLSNYLDESGEPAPAQPFTRDGAE
jgi:hypothetical protein